MYLYILGKHGLGEKPYKKKEDEEQNALHLQGIGDFLNIEVFYLTFFNPELPWDEYKILTEINKIHANKLK